MKRNLNEAEIINYLHKMTNNKFVGFILKERIEVKKLEKFFGIYAEAIKPKNIRERIHAKIVGKAIEEGAKKFGVDSAIIKNMLKEPYMRKGFAVVVKSIAEYGITKPQKLIAPFMVVWDFTRQCNLKCKHCYANATSYPTKDELSLKEKLNVVNQLDEIGVAAIAFSGGEPLISKDFWKVAKYAFSKGFYLAVATNGTLISEKIARRLKNIGIKYVEISLDGPNAKIHDKFRGIKGAFDATIRGIKNAIAAGIDVGIATTATKENIKHIPEIIKLARELKVKRFIVFNFVPTGKGKRIIKKDLSPEERENLMKYLYKEWKKGKMQIFSTSPSYARISITLMNKGAGDKFSPTHFAEIEIPKEFGGAAKALTEFIGGCGAGRIYCSVEHNGDMQPCVFIPIKVGNAIKDGFGKVWRNSDVLNKLRDRDDEKFACYSCAFKYICGGCRARAYAYYGNLLAPDPGCIFTKYSKKINQKLIVGGLK